MQRRVLSASLPYINQYLPIIVEMRRQGTSRTMISSANANEYVLETLNFGFCLKLCERIEFNTKIERDLNEQQLDTN